MKLTTQLVVDALTEAEDLSQKLSALSSRLPIPRMYGDREWMNGLAQTLSGARERLRDIKQKLEDNSEDIGSNS